MNKQRFQISNMSFCTTDMSTNTPSPKKDNSHTSRWCGFFKWAVSDIHNS